MRQAAAGGRGDACRAVVSVCARCGESVSNRCISTLLRGTSACSRCALTVLRVERQDRGHRGNDIKSGPFCWGVIGPSMLKIDCEM